MAATEIISSPSSQSNILIESSIETDQSECSPRTLGDGEEGQTKLSGSSKFPKYKRLLSWWNTTSINDGRYDGFKKFDYEEIVEEFPEGYPRFAALMDSDINTRMYRRFGLIRNRLLLHKQDQIAELFEKLSNLDKADQISHPERLFCRRYDEEIGNESPRTQILQCLDKSLKEYDTLLLHEHAIASLPSPAPRSHRSLFDWVYNNKPIVREEYQYLYDERDFLLLGNQQDQWLRSFQERIWDMSHNRLFKKLLASKPQTSDPNSVYSSNGKANLIIKIFCALAMTTLLMLPVVLLYVVDSSSDVKIAILLVFVLSFSLALLTITNASRHEAFAATAAYAAVLVVFMANLPTA